VFSVPTNNPLGRSRGEIVRLLRKRESARADELARALGLSKQCVRKHLDALERDGYVCHAIERNGRGRPVHRYRLTTQANELFPKRYELLSQALLEQVEALWGTDGLNAVFCRCAEEVIRRLRPQLEGLGFDARVRKLAQLLDGLGYEARAEKQPDGSYVLTEWNCPVTEVAREYRQLCDRELIVYRELLGAEVFRETRIVAGGASCLYRVLRPRTEKRRAKRKRAHTTI
jgi:predicted ArsR family transcriptional regulator